MNDINSQPIPSIGKGPAANQWNPDPEGHKSAHYYARFNPTQRLHAAWPPNRTGSMINISSSNPNSVRLGDSEDAYVRHTINSSIPLTYRTPPNTQFYSVPYYLSDENNNQLNEKLYQQQRNPPLAANPAVGRPQQDTSVEENFFDSEQHLDDQAELQYQKQQQRPPNQPPFVQQSQLQPQPVSQSRSPNRSPSPVNFDAQPNAFNQTPQDLYSKQQLQQQQLREFERQQAEKINRQQIQQNRSHHLPKQQNVGSNLSNNLINSQIDNEELIQQQYITAQPPQSQPPRAKSPVYRPVSPRNIYSKPPSNQSNQQESLSQQQIIVQQIPGGVQQQTVQYIQQPTVVKQVHQEQTYREQVEMQKQYYIQN